MKSQKFLEVLRATNHKRAHLILTEETMQQIRTYHEEGYTKRDMCELFGVGMHVMQRCFRQMGLRGEGGRPNKLTSHQLQPENTALFRAQQLEPLIRESFAKGISAVDVGKICNRNYSTINHYARLLGIPVQTRSEAATKRRGTLRLSGILLEILDGELLGDGCIQRPHTRSAHFTYATARGVYLSWLMRLLESHGLEGRMYGPRHNKGSFGTVQYDYHSKRYPEMYDLYKRWYPNGKKAVPRDIQLTPTVCRHWYIGDGCCFTKRKAHHSLNLSISTMGFSWEDVRFLQSLLEPVVPGTMISRQDGKPVLRFPKQAAPAFLAYIGPCPEGLEEVYGYKWGLPKNL